MERKEFQAESKRLLELMIHSIYTHKEIFLREIISNASDACDKLCYQALTDDSVKLTRKDFKIDLSVNKDARTITVTDNGIGMDKEDLENNLGVIASSGSYKFKQEVGDDTKDTDVIGQFGVGFYSAFMVCDQVTVRTRKFGSDTAYQWQSSGADGYTVTECDKSDAGTEVIMHLKDDTEDEHYSEFLEEWKLRELIKKYSDYIRFPIRMAVTKTKKVASCMSDKPDEVPYVEMETLNSMVPIWQRKKADVKPEEYNEFYKSNFHDFADPARTIKVHAEGALTYDALLFIPSRAPFDLYSKDYKKGLALYSSNVLIMDKCEELLPDCFNFVRGVVDSADLQLNISRETLQHNSQLRAIANKLEKKIKSELEKMRDNHRDDYEKFFEQFGRGLKFGIYQSYGMQKGLLGDLLLFYSAKQQKMVTFEEYTAAMPTDQKAIYYAAGDSTDRLAKLPVVNSVLDRGYDVLLCTQDVDEFTFQTMQTWGEGESAKELKNVASGDLGLETEDEKKAAEDATKENEGLFGAMKEALGDSVTKVAVSMKLATAEAAPACITAEGPVSLEMEKILSQMPDMGEAPKSDRVLEINAAHPVFATLKAAQEAGDAEKVKTYASLLYNQALLVEGMPLEDPVAFANAVASLMK